MQKPLTSKAKNLRKKSTDTEVFLWSKLRAKRFEGLKWRRQFPIGNYIVDFCCPEKMLIIECDGSQHIVQEAYDDKRTQWLKSQGYNLLRFWNSEVLENLNGALELIYKSVTPPLNPLPQGEGTKSKEYELLMRKLKHVNPGRKFTKEEMNER